MGRLSTTSYVKDFARKHRSLRRPALTNLLHFFCSVWRLRMVRNSLMGRFLPPRIVRLWDGAILRLTSCPGGSGLFGALNGRGQMRQLQPTLRRTQHPSKPRNNLDGDGDSWLSIFFSGCKWRCSPLRRFLPFEFALGIVPNFFRYLFQGVILHTKRFNGGL